MVICIILSLSNMPDYNKLVLSCSHTKAFGFFMLTEGI
jgi:hypothetical protein